MATMEDVAAIALALPGVTEGTRYGHRTWSVGGRAFAWERPLSKADVKRFGTLTPPDGPIAAVAVEDLGDKQAVLAAHPDELFTIEHFKNYPAVLIHLRKASGESLREIILDGWLVCAPPELAQEYLQR